jgi:hypothetical protein
LFVCFSCLALQLAEDLQLKRALATAKNSAIEKRLRESV